MTYDVKLSSNSSILLYIPDAQSYNWASTIGLSQFIYSDFGNNLKIQAPEDVTSGTLVGTAAGKETITINITAEVPITPVDPTTYITYYWGMSSSIPDDITTLNAGNFVNSSTITKNPSDYHYFIIAFKESEA